ncbi:UvrD-helicase domain-containing protein [Synechococcus sp. R60.3]|uniref:UvrD-helicase domain-containing protein n=1 Tax=Synechococcus sp. R60.3 TaxID=2967123 RepID=UPI0039C0EC69
MERRLFYREGTEEFRKSLDELAPYDREQILSKELPKIAEKWEREEYLPGDFIRDSVHCHKFSIGSVEHRLFLKVCTIHQDGIKYRICVPIRIFPRNERKYEEFLQKTKSKRYDLTKDTINQILSWIPSQTREIESNLPDCPEDLERFLGELGKMMPYKFLSDTIIVYESEQFCDWVDKQDETFLDVLHNSIYELIKKVSNGEVGSAPATAAQKCTVNVGQRKEAFWYRVQETNQIKRLLLAASASECEGIAEIEGRGTLRAYPSYILYDPPLWKDIARGRALSLPLSEEEQSKMEDIIIRRNLPVFISGRAGSGKSTMLYYLFSNYWYQLKDYRSRIIFLTYTETLRKNAERQIRCIIERMSRETNIEHFDAAGVWTLSDFLIDIIKKNAPDLLENYSKDKYLSYEKFATILRSRYDVEISPDICWHVIRTYIKGYYPDRPMCAEDYEKIPQKDKTVTLDEFKKAYEVYDWLASKYPDCWDELDLVRIILTYDYTRNHEYYIIFCDEAQDFTRVEIQLMLRLSFVLRYDFSRFHDLVVPIILAGDPLQTINPTGFRPQALGEAYYQLTGEMSNSSAKIRRKLLCSELTRNYRSSEGITKFSNLINLIRYTLLGIRPITNRIGDPQKPWRHSADIPAFVSLARFQEITSPDDFHIVIHPKLREIIRENPDKHRSVSALLNADQPNLWTPLEIKGLEQDCVIVYGFGEVLQQILPEKFRSKQVTLAESEFRQAICEHVQREDSTELRIQLEYFFSNLYVAVTRAVKRLFVVDSEEGRRILWDLLLSEDSWSEMLPEDKNGKNAWADKTNYQELVVEDELSAKPIDPEREAEKYHNLWREERNTDYCTRAIKWYRKVRKDKIANELQAELYEYEERWEEAAQAHEKAGNQSKAAVCWLRAGDWKQAKRVADSCHEKTLALDWIREWTEIRENLEQRLSSLSDHEQDQWVAGDFTSWLYRTLSHLEQMSGHDRQVARQETKRLIQDAQSRLRPKARRYLREKLLREHEQLLKDLVLVREIVEKLGEDYWQNKEFEKYLKLVKDYDLKDDEERRLWAEANCKGTLEGLKWLIGQGQRSLGIRFWKDSGNPWIDEVAELSVDLAKQGDVRDALYVAAKGNRSEYLSEILSMKQIKREDIVSALQELIGGLREADSDEILLPLLFVSLQLRSRDETFELVQLAVSRDIPVAEVAEYVDATGEHGFLVDTIKKKAVKTADEASLISALDVATYLLDVLSLTNKLETMKIEKDLRGYLSELNRITKRLANQLSGEAEIVAEKIDSLYKAIQVYNFSEPRRAAILRDWDELRQEVRAIKRQNRTESGEAKVLKGDECGYRVVISETQSVSSGEDDKAYFFAFTDTPIVVRLLKSERRLLCVNRDTGDSKSFFRSVKGKKEEPLWEIGVIRIVNNEGTIVLNGEQVMTVSVV